MMGKLENGPGYTYRKEDTGGVFHCLKYLMIILNVIVFAIGGGVLALGLVLVLDRFFASGMIGVDIYTACCWILIIVGIGIIVMALVGIVAGIKESRIVTLSYAILVGLFAFTLILAGILAAIFRTQLEDKMRRHMAENLRNEYGKDYTLTYSWNITQERLGCCAVDDQGWPIYRDTPWFKNTPSEIEGSSGKTLRMFVPPQCCKQSALGGTPLDEKYHLQLCTTKEDRPPGTKSGQINNALHYRGCYDALREFFFEHSKYIIGAGVAFGLILLGCVGISVIFYLRLTRKAY